MSMYGKLERLKICIHLHAERRLRFYPDGANVPLNNIEQLYNLHNDLLEIIPIIERIFRGADELLERNHTLNDDAFDAEIANLNLGSLEEVRQAAGTNKEYKINEWETNTEKDWVRHCYFPIMEQILVGNRNLITYHLNLKASFYRSAAPGNRKSGIHKMPELRADSVLFTAQTQDDQKNSIPNLAVKFRNRTLKGSNKSYAKFITNGEGQKKYSVDEEGEGIYAGSIRALFGQETYIQEPKNKKHLKNGNNAANIEVTVEGVDDLPPSPTIKRR